MQPFHPLVEDEIARAVAVVRPLFPECTLNFRYVTLKEPPKRVMIAHLEAPSSPLPRWAAVQVARTNDADLSQQLFELTVDLDNDCVLTNTHLPGRHSHIDPAFMKSVEAACLADAAVQKEIETLQLPDGAAVVVEPWAYATDGMNDMSTRVSMCWFYARMTSNQDANYYAYPLDLCAEVSESLQVTKVYRLPSSASGKIHSTATPFDKRKIQSSTSEYHPSLRPAPRTSTKPVSITQPDGPSFNVDGNIIAWEKWTMRVGFNYREGLTLHDIRYDGRQTFYRLSLAEMFVPYGDPRTPYPRKAAFDLGNDGAGICANSLKLGCDCIGHIKYFDWCDVTSDGEPRKRENVVCCHEQDDGILWKHTNFRTGNGVVARSRILILQTVITVSNYEYIFAFHFGQDASIHYEIRATGILSTAPIAIGDSVPFGTVVAPGVLAPYHQHLFCLRIDPAIDGHANSLVVTESAPMPLDDDTNPHGTGYTTTSSTVEREAGMDLSIEKGRVFSIVNQDKINSITGTPVGYKLIPSYSQLLLSHPSSYHARRSEFGQHAVWVTKYSDDEMFPSGKYTMQSAGGEGIASAIASRTESVAAQDIVIWHTFGSTHNPRIEDWPVMPSEKMMVGLKPVNFFDASPALDVQAAGWSTTTGTTTTTTTTSHDTAVTNGTCCPETE